MLTLSVDIWIFPGNELLLFPLALILMTQIYMLPPQQIFSLILAACALFFSLSYCSKPFSLFFSDLIATLIALAMALVSHFTRLSNRLDAYAMQQDLRRMCSIDGMTGVLNKTTFEYLTSRFLREQTGDYTCALGVIDLDQFKKVNDLYGHQMGDRVLLAFASLLQRVFGPDDGILIGRFGGDEFVILLKAVESADAARQKFQNLARCLGTLHEFDFTVTCSIGVSVADDPGLTFPQLFLAADRSLYEAKKSGRCQLCLSKYAANQKALPLMLVADGLESSRAILRNCFEDNFRILEASSGKDAFDLVERYRDSLAVILLDVGMPFMDGHTILQRIRRMPEMSEVPVIALSPFGERLPTARQSGAFAVLKKPLDPDKLVETVGSAMEHGKKKS